MRIRVCAVVLFAALLHLTAFGQAAESQTLPSPRLRVRLTLVVRDHISGVAWFEMTKECNRIWNAEGVDIEWEGSGSTGPPPDVTVPLEFNDHELEVLDRSKGGSAFGITVFLGRAQRMLVSYRRVRYLVGARRLVDSYDGTARDNAAGLILGRVVAHELGHVLLLTARHSDAGLMSPTLTGERLGPVGPQHFALSASDRDYIATRFSTGADGVRLAAR